jgi:hypothetical protein
MPASDIVIVTAMWPCCSLLFVLCAFSVPLFGPFKTKDNEDEDTEEEEDEDIEDEERRQRAEVTRCGAAAILVCAMRGAGGAGDVHHQPRRAARCRCAATCSMHWRVGYGPLCRVRILLGMAAAAVAAADDDMYSKPTVRTKSSRPLQMSFFLVFERDYLVVT